MKKIFFHQTEDVTRVFQWKFNVHNDRINIKTEISVLLIFIHDAIGFWDKIHRIRDP